MRPLKRSRKSSWADGQRRHKGDGFNFGYGMHRRWLNGGRQYDDRTAMYLNPGLSKMPTDNKDDDVNNRAVELQKA